MGLLIFAFWRAGLATGWKGIVGWRNAGVVAFAGAFGDAAAGVAAFAVAIASAAVFAVAIASAAVFAGAGASTRACAVAFAVSIASAFAGAGTIAGAVAFPVAFPVAFAFTRAAAELSETAIKHGRQGIFLALLIVAFVVAADLLASLKTWHITGPLLLFVGLLTLLNAPFDWASLGLTRALLRRGLELGGWWPYLLALIDACLAGVIIALLALTMVIFVQTFDELAVHGGGEKAGVLPLDALFDGIAKNPGAPEYSWAYALLLSTMIPSLVNLAIGGMAFTRGIPGVGRLLLNWIPEGRDVPDYRRPLAALGLTGQMFSGAFLGVAAQAVLAWVLLFHVMPWVGLDLLDMARPLAKFDVPLRAYQLFAGNL